MLQAMTFVNLLRDRAQAHPQRTVFTWLKGGETPAQSLTLGQVDVRARAIAHRLGQVLKPGDRALLVYPYELGLEFITAFLGCLYAGVVAVPSHPPRNRYGVADLVARLASAGASAILTPTSLQGKLQKQLEGFEPQDGEFSGELGGVITGKGDRWIIPEAIPDHEAADWQGPTLTSDTLAFLQFTSGSTGKPKGVMIPHGSLLHNQQALALAFGHTEQSVGVGWLPLFHDMGLIGNVMQPLYLGFPCVLMSPLDMIQKPSRWISAISTYRATTSGGPNFAYDLLCCQVSEAQRQTLDLTAWDVAFSGAEPVRPATLARFAQLYASCGFRPEAFYPCYGMAEATLFISGGDKAVKPYILDVDEEALEENRVRITSSFTKGDATDSSTEGAEGRSLVSCGHPWLDGRIVIADPQTHRRCPENRVGEIWVSGSGLGLGYWQQPEVTEQTFRAYLSDTGEGPFLRTGDLGFLQGDELFITGRLHDVMVFWGLNHYPQHIEETVQRCHPAFREQPGAAFSIKVGGDDRLVIAQEVTRRDRHRLTAAAVVEPIRWAVFDEHFVDVYAIALLKPGSLPKTPSGKIQRSACRTQYLNGSLPVIDEWRSPPNQISDIPTLIRRYLNPLVHVRRFGAVVRAWVVWR